MANEELKVFEMNFSGAEVVDNFSGRIFFSLRYNTFANYEKLNTG